jgi:acyl-CoA synthetase (AMP-forming)/AMP-acid ligase II
MIISGGEHIFPSEVEKVITSHSSVIECAVVGLHHPKWGEAVTAICVLASGSSSSNTLIESLLNLCYEELARFKVPKKVLFVEYDEMPRTGSGKVIHRVLRERFNNEIVWDD